MADNLRELDRYSLSSVLPLFLSKNNTLLGRRFKRVLDDDDVELFQAKMEKEAFRGHCCPRGMSIEKVIDRNQWDHIWQYSDPLAIF